MGKSLKVHQTNGTDNVDQTLSARDRKQLVRLGKLWKSDAERGLKTRHQVGRVLNERVGPPTRRKAHGRRVVELYGAELGIAPSDLNRMGWFSHLFPDLSALRTQHPEIDSWTSFKTALPNLKPAEGGKARQPALDPSGPALRGVMKSCTNLASKLNGLDLQLGKAERMGFLDAFRELGEAVSRRFRVRVEVAVGVKKTKPVVTKRSDRVARA